MKDIEESLPEEPLLQLLCDKKYKEAFPFVLPIFKKYYLEQHKKHIANEEDIELYENILDSMTEEKWEKEARKIAEERVKASLALQTIAVEQKVTVSDDLVAAKIAELRDVYKKSPEALKSLKDPNIKMNIKNRMIIEATLDYLVKTNK